MDKEHFSLQLNNLLNTLKIQGSFGKSVATFNDSLSCLLNQHAPQKTKDITVVDSAPWFDQEYIELRKCRRAAEKKKHKSIENYLKYKDLCKQANILALKKKKAYFKSVISKSNHKTKKLYDVVNKILDRKQTTILPDYTENIEQLTKDFNQYFTEKVNKIHKNIPTTLEPPILETFICTLYDFVLTTVSELQEIIAESGFNCSPADILPQKVYKDNITSFLPT